MKNPHFKQQLICIVIAACAMVRADAEKFIEIIELKQADFPSEHFYDAYLLNDGSVLLGNVPGVSNEAIGKTFYNLHLRRAHKFDSNVCAPLDQDGLIWLSVEPEAHRILRKERDTDNLKEIQKINFHITTLLSENRLALGQKESQATLWDLTSGTELWRASEKESRGLRASKDEQTICGQVTNKPAYWKKQGQYQYSKANVLPNLPEGEEGAISIISRDGTRMFGYFQGIGHVDLLQKDPEICKRTVFISDDHGHWRPLKEALLEGYERIRDEVINKLSNPSAKTIYQKISDKMTDVETPKFHHFVKTVVQNVSKNMSLEEIRKVLPDEDARLIRLYHDLEEPIHIIKTHKLYSVDGITGYDDYLLCGVVNNQGELLKYLKLKLKHNDQWIVYP